MLKTFLKLSFAIWNCLLRLSVLWRRKSIPLLYTRKTFSPKTVEPPLSTAILHPLSFIMWICSEQFWPFQTKYFFKGWKLAIMDTVLQAVKTIPNVNRKSFANGHSVGISIVSISKGSQLMVKRRKCICLGKGFIFQTTVHFILLNMC